MKNNKVEINVELLEEMIDELSSARINLVAGYDHIVDNQLVKSIILILRALKQNDEFGFKDYPILRNRLPKTENSEINVEKFLNEWGVKSNIDREIVIGKTTLVELLSDYVEYNVVRMPNDNDINIEANKHYSLNGLDTISRMDFNQKQNIFKSAAKWMRKEIYKTLMKKA